MPALQVVDTLVDSSRSEQEMQADSVAFLKFTRVCHGSRSRRPER